MPKFTVYAIAGLSKFVGEVEAENKEEAEKKAWDELEIDAPTLCHQCAGEWDTDDVNKLVIDEVE